MPIFQVDGKKVKQAKAVHFKNEKELQTLIENNLDDIFGISFIASEHFTGEKHSGRIDTLGLDENNNPVIIEYKWHEKDNIINQGLFYLDWLVDHKGDFELLVTKRLGKRSRINWGQPRLMLLAGSFNKYDRHAINSMAENIELWTYTIYENGIFEVRVEGCTRSTIKKGRKITDVAYEKYDFNYHLRKTSKELGEKFKEIRDKLVDLPGAGEVVEQKSGITYRTSKSFVRFEFKKSYIQILIRQPSYNDPKKLVRNVTSFRWGFKGLVKMVVSSDVTYIFDLIRQSYEETL